MRLVLPFIIWLCYCFPTVAQIDKNATTEHEHLLLYGLDTQYLRYCQTVEADILDTILRSPFMNNSVLKQNKKKPIIRIFDLTQQFYPCRDCWKISYAIQNYKVYIYDKLPIDLNSGVYYDLVITAYRKLKNNQFEIEVFYNLNSCDNLQSNPNLTASFIVSFKSSKPFIISSLYSEIDD